MQSQKTLILIRHAHALATYAAGVNSDAERPLSPEGQQKAAQTARQLARLGLTPQKILTSPLLRAVQTAQVVADTVKAPVEKATELNGFSQDEEVAEFLLSQLEQTNVLIAVGHNPNISCVYHLFTKQVRPFSAGQFAVLSFDENNVLEEAVFGE